MQMSAYCKVSTEDLMRPLSNATVTIPYSPRQVCTGGTLNESNYTDANSQLIQSELSWHCLIETYLDLYAKNLWKEFTVEVKNY